jgi:hypothetical protein
MTESDFFNSGCFNHHCKFTFSQGQEITGVVRNFRGPKDMQYYLVTTPNLIKYKEYEKANDEDGMRRLTTIIDLNDLVRVVRLHANQNAF